MFDLRKPKYVLKNCPLSYQTRFVSLFPDGNGYIAGSISGRCTVQSADKKSKNNYRFSCHRTNNNKEPGAVNGASWYSGGMFATCGSDGTICFWDKSNRQLLKQSPRLRTSISCLEFDKSRKFLAYALSYDYTKGPLPQMKQNKIFLQQVDIPNSTASGSGGFQTFL